MKNAKKFFSDHKIRHEIAKLLDMGISFIESSIIYDEDKAANLMKTKIKWFDNFVNGLIDMVKFSQPFLDSLARTELLKEFDKFKNRGFYTVWY